MVVNDQLSIPQVSISHQAMGEGLGISFGVYHIWGKSPGLSSYIFLGQEPAELVAGML